MKKNLFLLLLLPLFSFAQEGIAFNEISFKDLLAKAKTQDKMIFIDAYTSWCGPCKIMAKNIFPQKEVAEYYNSHFINAQFDMEKGEGKELAEKYKVFAFPTFLFIDKDGNVLHRFSGYKEAEDFIQLGKDAQNPEKQTANLEKKYKQGEKSPEFLKNYSKTLLYTDPVLAERVAGEYFLQKKDYNYTMDEIQLLFSSAKNHESDLFKYILTNKENIEKLIGPQNYEVTTESIILNSIQKKAISKDKHKFNDALFLKEAQKYMPKQKAEQRLKQIKMDFFLKNNEIKAYEKMALSYYQNYPSFSSEELNNIAWNFYENVTTPSSLKTAVMWAEESVKQNS